MFEPASGLDLAGSIFPPVRVSGFEEIIGAGSFAGGGGIGDGGDGAAIIFGSSLEPGRASESVVWSHLDNDSEKQVHSRAFQCGEDGNPSQLVQRGITEGFE